MLSLQHSAAFGLLVWVPLIPNLLTEIKWINLSGTTWTEPHPQSFVFKWKSSGRRQNKTIWHHSVFRTTIHMFTKHLCVIHLHRLASSMCFVRTSKLAWTQVTTHFILRQHSCFPWGGRGLLLNQTSGFNFNVFPLLYCTVVVYILIAMLRANPLFLSNK